MSDTQTTIDQAAAVTSRAVTDAAFRQQLLTAPAATLQAAGIAIPSGMQVQVLENTATLVNLVIPSRPAEVSDADLKSALSSSVPPAGSSTAEQLAALDALFIQSWSDSTLQASLLQNPAATLAAHGINVRSGVQVRASLSTSSAAFLVLPPSASASHGATTDPITIGSVATSITQSFANLAKLITAGSYVAGLGFSIGAILKFKQHKDNPTQIPVGTPIALLFIGAALLFLPSILDAAGGKTS